MKNWLKDKLGITALERENRALREQVSAQGTRIDERIRDLDKLTSMDADVGFRGDCTVILTGVYRGKAYVQFYDMPTREFAHHVDMLRDMRKSNLIRNVDAPREFVGSFSL